MDTSVKILGNGQKVITYKIETLEYNEDGEVVQGYRSTDIILNPTNMIFAEKLFSTFDEVDKIGEKYQKKLEETDNSSDLFAITHDAEQDMREKMNALFGKDICAPLLGEYESIYASDGDGLPIWANILFATIDEIDSAFVAEKEKTNPRIKKYIAKYSKKK